jgi:hypothetical protein
MSNAPNFSLHCIFISNMAQIYNDSDIAALRNLMVLVLTIPSQSL